MKGRGGSPSTLQLVLRAYLQPTPRVWELLPLRMSQKPCHWLYSVLADGQPGAPGPRIQV